jgi:hypothetical protein
MTVTKKKSVQVYLEDRHLIFLNQLMQELGISQTEVLQRGLESLVREILDPVWLLIGLAGEDADGPDDLSVEHDRYLVEQSSND